MSPWLETSGVTILAFLAFFLGQIISRLKKNYWILGCAFPLFLLFWVGLVRRVIRLNFVAPFSWIVAGRAEFVILSLTIPMLLGTLISRVEKIRLKILLTILLVVSSIHYVILPFLIPPLIRNRLEKLQNHLTDDGICIQSTGYTCGPAAAVTALNRLGIEAQEGEIAVLSYTTPSLGTADDLLSRAIQKRYGGEGVTCCYRYFNSISELKDDCPTIATIKFAPFVDHYVTVLEVLDDRVIIGDPLVGKQTLTFKEFEKRWRFIGIVVTIQKKLAP